MDTRVNGWRIGVCGVCVWGRKGRWMDGWMCGWMGRAARAGMHSHLFSMAGALVPNEGGPAHLCLWVDEQRPAPRLGHHDAVVDGERVVGQPVDGPVADLDGIAQDFDQAAHARGEGALRACVCSPMLVHTRTHSPHMHTQSTHAHTVHTYTQTHMRARKQHAWSMHIHIISTSTAPSLNTRRRKPSPGQVHTPERVCARDALLAAKLHPLRGRTLPAIGTARCGKLGQGWARFGQSWEWLGKDWAMLGKEAQCRQGRARIGKGLGMAGHGLGKAGQGWEMLARLGRAGQCRQGWQRRHGWVRRGNVGKAGQCWQAWVMSARLGKAPQCWQG
eukprot:357268-Chlamydomonas_euryale.AAC.1